MTPIINHIKHHLSLRLGLLILLVVGSVFGVTLALLFYKTKQLVQETAEQRAMEVLDQTVLKITDIMNHTEAVTADMERKVQQHLTPDSLLVFTKQLLEQEPDILGFTIAMKPDFFPSKGRCYSAYSLRQGDSITTVVEDLDYYNQVWYWEPWNSMSALWLEPYIDNAPGFLTSSEYNFSYVKPLYTSDNEPIGVLCTDLLLKWLSQTVTEVKPFPHSSAIMLGHDGRYILHPDTTKLVRQSIFSDPDPKARQQIIPLSQSMLSGESGAWPLIVDGKPAHIFFRPLERTGWSIAIVCPDSDVFSSYNKLLNFALAVLLLFLILLLLFCYQTIRRAVVPINQLAASAHRIADGEFALTLQPSHREDTIGQLRNSFVQMQKAIQASISNLQSINAETEQRNKELERAYQLVREADARKTAFIQDMYHQIRTPLNVINGFTQVLTERQADPSEIADITKHMRKSASDISHLTHIISEAAGKEKG